MRRTSQALTSGSLRAAVVLVLALSLPAGSCAAGSRRAAAAVPAAVPAAAAAAPVRSAPCPQCPDTLPADGMMSIGLTGKLVREGEGFVLEGCAGRTPLAGSLGESVMPLAGRDVWLNAICAGGGTVAALGGHAVGDSVVDLFVMGLCPAARSLERQVAAMMARGDSLSHPPIRLHFIFFAQDSAGTQVFFAKHGAAEFEENLVQMALQELEPAKLWAYIGARATSDEPWTKLAGGVGVSWRTLSEIQRRLGAERIERARVEWTNTAVDWPRIEASPTVFWRGLEVRDLAQVPGFGATTMTQERCSN